MLLVSKVNVLEAVKCYNFVYQQLQLTVVDKEIYFFAPTSSPPQDDEEEDDNSSLSEGDLSDNYGISGNNVRGGSGRFLRATHANVPGLSYSHPKRLGGPSHSSSQLPRLGHPPPAPQVNQVARSQSASRLTTVITPPKYLTTCATQTN